MTRGCLRKKRPVVPMNNWILLPGKTPANYLRFAARLAEGLSEANAPMEERRKYPRTEINQPAYVSSGGSVMSCVVRNISAEGAAIDVENAAFVPPHFRLVMASDSSVHECNVAWIQQNRIGVIFVAAPPSGP